MPPARCIAIALILLASCRPHGLPPMHAGARPPSPVHLGFQPESAQFAAAAREYQRLWDADHTRIVAAMESISGLRFDSPPYADTLIDAIVFEGVSYSGHREVPMKLRASYAPDTKRATLIHELGHRLQTGIAPQGQDEHEVLFLWLYDVWVALYGRAFADAQVTVERARGGPYPRAWDAALALDRSQRAARFRALVQASEAR